MKRDTKKLAEDILDYLSEFKNEKGEKPNPVYIGLIIHDYCDLFIKSKK